MLEFFYRLCPSDGFLPHGHCYLWIPGVVWLHVISDALIALSFYSIPLTLVWWVRQRRDLDFRWMFLCFAAFILACGTTHLLEIWNVWHGNYWISGVGKALTAAASLPTAFLLTRHLPQALLLPSSGALRQANEFLSEELVARRQAEEDQRAANLGLETRVAARTAALLAANAELRRQISKGEQLDDRVLWLASFPEQDPNPIAELDWASGALRYANPEATRLFPDLSREGLAHPWLAGVRQFADGCNGQDTAMERREVQCGEAFYLLTATCRADTQRVRVYGTDITERKMVEAALESSRAEFMDLFDNAPAGYHEVDAEGRIARINRTELKMLGYTADELLGQSVWKISAEEEVSRRAVAEKLRGKMPSQAFERSLKRKDGSCFPVLIEDRLVRGANGEITGIRSVIKDNTERKQMEMALRENEERFRTMANSIPQLAWIARPDGFVYWFNQRWYAYTGTTPEQMEGGDWQSVHDPEMLPKVMEHWAGAIASGEPFEMEFPLRGAEGSFRSFLTRVQPLKDAEGKVVQWFGTNTDVETLKQAETALRTSEEHFRFLNDLSEAMRRLADPAQIMAVTARMLGEHLRASRCAYADVAEDGERFSILHDDTDGCASTVGSYQLSHFGPRAVATLHGGQTLIIRDVNQELVAGEGAEMFRAIGIQAIITCPLVKHGRLCAMMAVQQTNPRAWQPGEITIVEDVVERCWATIERRKAEETIQQFNAGLEQRVIERTAQLEEANKELEAFSYSVSHDLRAPLRAVDGFSRAVVEDYGAQLPEEGQRYLQTIRNGAQRMGVLIDDLLTFSRLSRLPMVKRTIDTGGLVRECLADLHSPREGSKLEIKVGNLPPSDGDPALLKQVWINLLSNACKYTLRRAEARIEIGATEQQGECVYFVRDNGAGFDMRYAGKLFGVFQRLHRADEYEGTGVGLAIVQRIVHRHGGRVWAEAEVGRGATFHFTLPNKTNL